MHTTCHQLKGEIIMLERLLRVIVLPLHVVGFCLAISVFAIFGISYCPVAYIVTSDPLKGLYWIIDWAVCHGEHIL